MSIPCRFLKYELDNTYHSSTVLLKILQWHFCFLFLFFCFNNWCLEPLPVAYKVLCDMESHFTPSTLLPFSLCSSHTRLLIFHRYAKHLSTWMFFNLLPPLSKVLSCHGSIFLGRYFSIPLERTFLTRVRKSTSPVIFSSHLLLFIGPSQHLSLLDIKLNTDLHFVFSFHYNVTPWEHCIYFCIHSYFFLVHSKVPIQKYTHEVYA